MALVIDEIIMIVAAVLCLIVIEVVISGQSFGVTFFVVIFLSFAILLAVLMGYWIVFTAIWGQTLGKMALGIKVVDREGRTSGIMEGFPSRSGRQDPLRTRRLHWVHLGGF